MEYIFEIKDILNQLNPREKKAAKKFFSRHYANTKELQLLRFIDSIDGSKRINIENRICKMGYESGHSKSFLKLKSRLKEKLYDFMSSSISMNEIRNIDSNSFLKHRLKKTLFQSGLLIEKSMLFQSSDLLRSTIRLAQETEQFDALTESFSKLKTISELRADRNEQIIMNEKHRHYSILRDQFENIQNQFYLINSELDSAYFNSPGKRICEFLDMCETNSVLQPYQRFTAIQSFVEILQLQFVHKENEALRKSIKWLKNFRDYPATFDIRIKVLYANKMIDLLHSTGHKHLSQKFANHSLWKSIPNQYKFQLRFIKGINNFDEASNRLSNLSLCTTEGCDQINLDIIYLNAHILFKKKDYRKCTELINSNVRAYHLASVQQIDLMILDLMAHFEMEHYDLLEYKIQSFVKNLAYRSKFDIPGYYHQFSKIMRQLIRMQEGKTSFKIKDFMKDLESIDQNSLLKSRSIQPKFFKQWTASYLIKLESKIHNNDTSSLSNVA